ncbi:MAG: DUF4249 domain-containing protein [Bacteroidota bacterium]
MKKIFFIVLPLLVILGCREIFESPVKSPSTGYLVVEGAINSGEGSTIIILSRTTSLDDKKMLYEKGAIISIEGEDKSSRVLKENPNGQYIGQNLGLNSNQKYQLKIITSRGKKYLSDFVAVNINQPIDSLSLKRENGGVQIYVNTQNSKNSTNYYQWETEQTWEYHAEMTSALKYEITGTPNRPIYKAVYRFPKTPGTIDSSLFMCWESVSNTNLLIANTEKLTKDLIYHPLAYIPPNSNHLNVLYSINVRQITWSKEGYEFLDRIQKNTEKTGSIFDAQPSELNGNIHNVDDPTEPVIGFANISPIQEKRIYLNRKMFDDWYFPIFYCKRDTLVNTSAYIIANEGVDLIPIQNGDCFGCGPLDVKVFFAAEQLCVDCTLKGGTNKRPTFWPK